MRDVARRTGGARDGSASPDPRERGGRGLMAGVAGRSDDDAAARGKARFRSAPMSTIAIALLAGLVLCLSAAIALKPRFEAAIEPAAISGEGGHAYTFRTGFSARWPYAVPSHPDFALAPGDVRVAEDGRPVGALEPSHDVIRQKGGGLFNFWDGTIWFSSVDGTDPRTNGRSYTLKVKARLMPSAAWALGSSLAALAALVLCRAAPAAGAGFRRLGHRWSPVLRGVPGFSASSRSISTMVRIVRRVPLSPGKVFALFCTAMLALFCWGTLIRPMPLVFAEDSFTYVHPGVLWAAGQSVMGRSTRDVGYAFLTMLALRLGSLAAIPPLQLLAVVLGIACILAVLYMLLAAMAARLGRTSRLPGWVSGVFGCAAAAAYVVMLVSHDRFVIEIYRAMAEAPHLLMTALALLLFVRGWIERTPVRRLASMVLSVVAAFLSIMVKPHTSMVLALCALGLIVTVVRDHRAFRSPLILTLCILSTAGIVEVLRFDAWVTPSGYDFGPKTLFCNHLDVAEPVFDASTPERARVMDLLRGALRNPNRWPLLGFSGDLCMYENDFNRAMEAAARSEGVTPPDWERREFIRAVLKNPTGYVRAVWNQLAYFSTHPIGEIDDTGRSVMTDEEWRQLEPYFDLIGMSRDKFGVEVTNWVPAAHPWLTELGRSLLQFVSATYAIVTLGSTLAASLAAVALRRRTDGRLETVVLAVAAFTAAFIATPALAHTFDVPRYTIDILPFSLLWWVMGSAYLCHGFFLLLRRSAPLSFAPARGFSPSPGRASPHDRGILPDGDPF